MIKAIFLKSRICRAILRYPFQIKDCFGITVSDSIMPLFSLPLSHLGYPKGSGAYVFRPLSSIPEPISSSRNM